MLGNARHAIDNWKQQPHCACETQPHKHHYTDFIIDIFNKNLRLCISGKSAPDPTQASLICFSFLGSFIAFHEFLRFLCSTTANYVRKFIIWRMIMFQLKSEALCKSVQWKYNLDIVVAYTFYSHALAKQPATQFHRFAYVFFFFWSFTHKLKNVFKLNCDATKSVMQCDALQKVIPI